MVDPSVLLTRAGLTWFTASVRDGGPAVRSMIVSESFYWIVNEGPEDLLLPFVGRRDRELIGFAKDTLRATLDPIERFSYESIAELPPDVEMVRDALLRSARPETNIYADQWIYLATQSWMLAKNKAFLSRVQRAGAAVLELIPRSTHLDRALLVHSLISKVIPEAKVPDVLTPDLMRAAGIKWVIYCLGSAGIGATAGMIGGPLGGAIGAVVGGVPISSVLQAFDP